MITSVDELSVGYDPLRNVLAPPTPSYFSHSCAAVDEFLGQVASARGDASYQADYAVQVVYIETATLTVVPEPARATMAAVAWLGLLLMRGQRKSV